MEEQFDTTFEAMLAEKMRERSKTAEDIAEETGIAISHINNLIAGNYNELPPAPYLRGYLIRIGAVLNFDAIKWWKAIKRENQKIKSSGGMDLLPTNRFIKKNKYWIWLIAVIIILALYSAFRMGNVVGRPGLNVSIPQNETVFQSNNRITFRGTINEKGQVFVNDELVPIAEDGGWEKEIVLSEGLNIVEVRGEKFLGGSEIELYQVIYESQNNEGDPSTETLLELNPSAGQGLN